MIKNHTLLIILIFSLSIFGSDWQTKTGMGKLAIIQSRYAPFPHSERAQGHHYRDAHFPFEKHYNDSSVAVFIPDGFQNEGAVDLVFYFHGWGNHIEKSLEKFQLLEQFTASGKNAVFVFPQGPRDASDSFGGKLEEKNVFKNLVNEILEFLSKENIICDKKPGRIILSGHSGAYRVIAQILNRGGLTDKIAEVYLFDALYGQFEKFTRWLDHYNGKLINIITPNGGTYENSRELLQNFEDRQMSYLEINSNDLSPEKLKNKRIIFIFTDLEHSAVINPYFRYFLKASGLENLKH